MKTLTILITLLLCSSVTFSQSVEDRLLFLLSENQYEVEVTPSSELVVDLHGQGWLKQSDKITVTIRLNGRVMEKHTADTMQDALFKSLSRLIYHLTYGAPRPEQKPLQR